jgi:hypothetical protein
MQWSDADRTGLGVALNEATLLGVEVNEGSRRAAATFAVLTLPPLGPMPKDPRVRFIFEPVGRVIASLRLGRWNDSEAPVESFPLDRLLLVVQSFCSSIYGWEFFDCEQQNLSALVDRLSLDRRLGPDGCAHSISLFQERPDRHLDLWVWFDRLTIRDPSGRTIELEEFIAGGRRWWDAFNKGDERVSGCGIFPLSADACAGPTPPH